MKTETFRVEGMHCRSCEMLVEDALSDIGAKDVSPSYEKGEIRVTYDESLLNREKIKEAIRGEGYEVIK